MPLTPLGSMLAAAVFEGCAPAPDADADVLVPAISEVPPPVARTMARPWLDARSAVAAARELLTFAEPTGGEQRVAALALGGELGREAAEAWREWAERPGFGAYAWQWLAAHGEATVQDPADEAWLTVDALSIMLDALPDMVPPLLLAAVLQQEGGRKTCGNAGQSRMKSQWRPSRATGIHGGSVGRVRRSSANSWPSDCVGAGIVRAVVRPSRAMAAVSVWVSFI